MATWWVQDAQAHLDEIIDKALHEGPQVIADNGAGIVVVAEDEFRGLQALKLTLKDHLLGGPLVDDFEIERDNESSTDWDR